MSVEGYLLSLCHDNQIDHCPLVVGICLPKIGR